MAIFGTQHYQAIAVELSRYREFAQDSYEVRGIIQELASMFSSDNPNFYGGLPMNITTPAQRDALWNLYRRASIYRESYPKFRRRFSFYPGGYLGGEWLGMFFGIEPDGYTHT